MEACMWIEWKYDGGRVEVDFTVEIQLKEVACTSHHNVLARLVMWILYSGGTYTI